MINIRKIIDDAKCYQTVRDLRWLDGVRCPYCDSGHVTQNGHDEAQPDRRRYNCRACVRFFDDLTGTIFASHFQPLRAWFLCLYYMGSKLSNDQIAQELDLEPDEAHRMTSQLREAITQRKPEVMKLFLPHRVPKIPGYQFFAYYNPVEEVGGDYYDFIQLPSNQLGIALGDVSGHGISASLMMAKFSGDTRFCVLTEPSPQIAIEKLNNLICDAEIDEKFMTMSLSILDIEKNRVTFCSAGHPPSFLRRANGHVEELGDDISGFPLGVTPDWQYKQLEVDIHPGDVMVIYSDGVTDARNPAEELYDSREQRRLIKRVMESGGSAEKIGKSILQEIREFSLGHKQFDDITLICFGPVPA